MPGTVFQSTLEATGKDYVAYLADARERSDADAGKPIGGSISVALPKGEYVARFYSPVAGEYSPGIFITAEGDKRVSMELPEFRHDVVLRVTRRE